MTPPRVTYINRTSVPYIVSRHHGAVCTHPGHVVISGSMIRAVTSAAQHLARRTNA